jgi:hypothetical protein
MIVRPTSSYQIELPEDIRRENDERVSSFWIDQQPLLLQVSSFQRTEGVPVAAKRRLLDRIEKTPSDWKEMELEIVSDASVDQAFAEQREGGLVWLHCYFVWPHLTVYATISGPEREVRDPQSWAAHALGSMSLVIQ